MRNQRRGFTLLEVLVTVSVLTVVMALLIYPIIAAYGYIKKAQATTEAQGAADRAMQRMSKELSAAAYVFDIPPDGNMVTFIPGTNGEAIDTSSKLGIIRYARVLDFPFNGSDEANNSPDPRKNGPPWALVLSKDAQKIHHPFSSTKVGMTNPYLIARYDFTDPDPVDWAEKDANGQRKALINAMDPDYPLSAWDTMLPGWRDLPYGTLQQRYRNKLVAITPMGSRWDITRFQVTPLRIVNEPLAMPTLGRGKKNPTVVIAHYPMWAGRNLDIDDLFYSQQNKAPKTVVDDAIKANFNLTTLESLPLLLKQVSPLYPLGSNPFGYQIRVFDNSGAIVYGVSSNGNSMMCQRHFMEWPPIGRTEFNWSSPQAFTLWSQDDIEQQRRAGTLVFAQPMETDTLSLTTSDDLSFTTLDAPQGWDSGITYLLDASLPQTISLHQGGITKTFRRVATESELRAGTYCLPNIDTNKYDRLSRIIAFGEPLAGDWSVVTASGAAARLRYSICDLQPTDLVVGTYSTKGILDVALTVERQDTSGSNPQRQRQEYSTTARVTVRNAVQHARGGR